MLTIESIQPLKRLKSIESGKRDYPVGFKKWAPRIDTIVKNLQSGLPPRTVASKEGITYRHLNTVISAFGYNIKGRRKH